MEKKNISPTDTSKAKYMDRKDFDHLVADRLKAAAEDKHIKQEQIIAGCAKLGYKILQGDVSKLLGGNETLDPYKLLILCKVLDVNPEDVLSPNPNVKRISKRENAFITDGTKDKFSGYIGKYYGYFFSTADKVTIHNGEFEFSVDPFSHKCLVSFSFKTGQRDKSNRPIIKVFSGTAKISKNLDAICCEMTAEDKSGDASYIIFKHLFTNNIECMCRLGMVVTIGAGEKRLPTAHKLLISRKKLTRADYPFIGGQLKLNDNSFVVSDKEYKEFKQDPNLPTSIKSSLQGKNDILLSKAKRQVYYSFMEDDISNLEIEECEKIISLLRAHSESKSCKKIGQKGEKFTFDYINSKGSTKKNTRKT